MPQHTLGYVDQALSNVSNAWFNQDSDFISDKIFPEVLVGKKTFKVWEYSKDNLRVPSSSVRTGRSKAQEASFSKSTVDHGPLLEHSLSDFIEKDEYDQEDAPLNVESDTVENLNHLMALIDENDLATTMADTGVITQNDTLSGTDQWSDYSASNPFTDITAGVTAVKGSALRMPNTAFMGWEVWLQIINHPDFLDRIKWSATGVVTEADFLKLLQPYGITKLYIGKAQKNTANEGASSDTIGSVWGKHFWLGYVTDRPGRKEVNGGYKFRLRNGREVTREVSNNPPGTEIVTRDYYEHSLMDASCFYLIKDAIA